MKMDAETGIMSPQAKKLLEAGRGKEGAFPYRFQTGHGPQDGLIDPTDGCVMSVFPDSRGLKCLSQSSQMFKA